MTSAAKDMQRILRKQHVFILFILNNSKSVIKTFNMKSSKSYKKIAIYTKKRKLNVTSTIKEKH